MSIPLWLKDQGELVVVVFFILWTVVKLWEIVFKYLGSRKEKAQGISHHTYGENMSRIHTRIDNINNFLMNGFTTKVTDQVSVRLNRELPQAMEKFCNEKRQEMESKDEGKIITQ